MSENVSKQELTVAMREQTYKIVSAIQSFVMQIADCFNKIEKVITDL